MYNYDELVGSYLEEKTLIVVEKLCGYKFVVPLLEHASLLDLYRYVELYYNHIKNEPLNLYYVKDNIKLFVPKNTTNLLNFLRNNNIRPCTDFPEKVMYNLRLDICGNHC